MRRIAKRIIWVLLAVGGVAFVADLAWSLMTRVAEPAYSVDRHDGEFEIRSYAPRIVAETVVSGTWGEGGNEGFRRLAGYIFGKNTASSKIAMTAPVGQRADGRKLAMTAPVGQKQDGAGWLVSFTMPAGETLASLPRPLDERVVLRQLPVAQFAVVRFSGRWRDDTFRERTEALRAWAARQRLTAVGEPESNRYNPPWTLWFLRRNEVWLPVAATEKT